jgi:hypothetical protein
MIAEKNLSQYNVEKLLKEMLDLEEFKDIWDGKIVSNIYGVLNKRFEVYSQIQQDHRKFAPFVSTYGPSVYECEKCGVKFGDITVEPTVKLCEQMTIAKVSHFREVYHADHSGRPTTTSGSFSCNRAVMQVLCKQFPGATNYSSEMAAAVSKKLLEINKGNIYIPETEKCIIDTIDSYLECRRRGQVDAPPNLVLSNLVRARKEREVKGFAGTI